MYDAFPETPEHELPVEQPRELDIEFRGSAQEYFRVWAVNLCLTLLTFGLFSAWAKVRKKRYFYSHTVLDGTPFQYLGRPLPILIGRLVAAVLFGLYYFSANLFTGAMPYVLVAALFVAPWVVVRSAAFNARYSAWRNMTFHFDATYWDAFKVVHWMGLIPTLVIAGLFDFWGDAFIVGLLALVASVAMPFWMRNLKALIVEHTVFGGRRGEFGARGGSFFKIYFLAGLIVFGVVVVTMLILTIAMQALGNFEMERGDAMLPVLIISIPIYAGYVLAFAYVQANTSNLVWNATRIGPALFKSTLTGRGLAWIYLTNALAILVSLGLLIPWAVIRTIRYRVDHLEVDTDSGLTQFRGSDRHRVRAAGAELGEFFELDLSL